MNQLTTNYYRMHKYGSLCKRIGICAIIQLMAVCNPALAGLNGEPAPMIQSSLQQTER